MLFYGSKFKDNPDFLTNDGRMKLPVSLAGARWIASPLNDAKSLSPAPYLRKNFVISGGIRQAHLHISALGLYECEINGKRVGNDLFAPGWTDYHKRVFYQTHDITSLLCDGDNAIGVILGDGWYCGQVGWRKSRQNYGDRPSLLACLEITTADGRTLTVKSDASWRCSTGPILENDFLAGETYDARLELDGWSSAGFDDCKWSPVLVRPTPKIALQLSPGLPVREQEQIEPVSVTTLTVNGASSRLFDLGQNFAGYAVISVRAARGRKLTLRFAEILQPDGTPYYANLRSAKATDHYICRGNDMEHWRPRFTFHGFRYIEVSGLDANDEFAISGIVTHSELPPTGHFACSNPLLNQLQHNIVWGQKSNFIDIPTDCPQRDERLGWTGDAQVFIRTACFNRDVRKFFHKWCLNLRDTQNSRGYIPPVAPNLPPGKNLVEVEEGGPAWADAMVICPWTIYLCYGDKKILADNYAAMKKYVEGLQKYLSRDLIRSHPDAVKWGGFGDWLALDGTRNGWGGNEGGTPKDLIGTAFFAYDTEIMAKVATVLGHKPDAAKFRRLHRDIVAAFRRRFVTADGLLVGATQTAYVLALHFGLLPEKLRAKATRELVREIEKREFHLGTGFVGTPYILDVLAANGQLDIAYKLLEQESFPSWLFPVKNGATTIWERWDGWHPERGFQDVGMNSFNHYAYGAVGAWMVSSLAGLDLDERHPGYRHIKFHPRPGGSLTWAEASLQTANGEVSIRWQLRGRTLTVKLNVPPGSSAAFFPPEGFVPNKSVALTVGRHELQLKKK
jgi:alpha-L-rhamnosidase